ncbi:hypothetical protein D3C86_1647680 [compost metagenome]
MIKTFREIIRGISWPARWVSRRWRRFNRYATVHVEDLPDQLKSRVLYVVGEGDCPLHASMSCPLKRCSTVLNMNLVPDEQPMWTLNDAKESGPTLSPSVWRRTACGCHFFLRDGQIEWC